MELRSQGDSFDWFFLALIELKLGHKDLAADWYEKAVVWFHQTRPEDRELYRFQTEAAEALGLPKPALPPRAPAAGRMPSAAFPIDSSDLPRRLRSRAAEALPRPAAH
jgi:hypothetical protein